MALTAQNVLMLIVQHVIPVTPLPVWSARAHIISTGLFANLAYPNAIVVVAGTPVTVAIIYTISIQQVWLAKVTNVKYITMLINPFAFIVIQVSSC